MKGQQLLSRALVILLLFAGAASAARSQTGEDELRSEIEALKRSQEEMRKEIQEIRRLLTRSAPRPAAAAARSIEGQVFELGQNPVRGADSAPLTLIEFLDFQ